MGYEWERFARLDGYTQADIVAAHLIKQRSEAVIAYEQRPKRKKRG